MNKAANKGPQGFEAFYSSMHADRWPALKEALLAGNKKVDLWNPFCGEGCSVPDKSSHLCITEPIACSTIAIPKEPERCNGFLSSYQLDLASVIPALVLDPQPEERLLDMCSAPGGKALSLIFASSGQADYVLNDSSLQRVKRLKGNLSDYLPEGVRRRVHVTHHDASRWGLYEKEAYDRVMLDAPCSGEAHLLASSKELGQWSQQRSKRLAVRQYALLCAALDVVKPGGRIVYSTCSVSRLENDEVIQKLLKKRKGQVEVTSPRSEIMDVVDLEKSDCGYQIWPDRAGGWGPIYFAVLHKLERAN